MRKNSFTPSLKRGAYSLLALVGLVLVGLGIANAESLTLGQTQTVEYSGVGIQYEFTAPSTGVLKVTLTPAGGYSGVNYGPSGETEILYTASGAAVPSISNNGQDVGAPFLTNVTEATFNVTEGESYFVRFPYWEGSVLAQMEGGTTDPDPGTGDGGDDDDNVLSLNVAYPAPVNGTISFTEDGTLTATFTEDGGPLSAFVWDAILFTDAACTDPVPAQGDSGFTNYSVSANVTYYVKAVVSELTGDGAPFPYPFEVTFTFVADGGTTEPGPDPGDDSDWTPAVIGQTYDIPDGTELCLTLTTETAGELVINQWGTSDSVVFTIPTNDPEDWTNRVFPEYMGENPSVCTYYLAANTTYYIFVKHDNAAWLECSQIDLVSYSGDLTGEGGESGWEKAVIGQTYDIPDGTELCLTFTTETAGEFVINQWGTSDSVVFTIPTNDPEDWTNRVFPEYMGENPSVCTYYLDANTTYYIFVKHDNAAYLECSQIELVSYSGALAGEGGSETPGPEVDGYDPLVLGQTYYFDSVGGTKLYFTATQNGFLKVTQGGTYESHVWTAVPNTEDDGIYINDNIYGVGYGADDTDPYTLTYAVEAGKTYYIYGKINQYDDITTFTAVFETVIIENEIYEDIETAIPGLGIYKYVATGTGVLNISTNKYETSLGNLVASHVFYTDPTLVDSSKVAPISGGDSSLNGFMWDFQVTAGETYYVYNPSNGATTFLLTLKAGETVTAKLVSVEPTAGTVFDWVNYMYSWNITFSPKDATASNATLTYTNAQGQTVTENLDTSDYWGYDAQRGVFGVPSYRIYQLMSTGQASQNSDFIFDLYEVKAGGAYVTESEVANGVEIGPDGHITIKFINGTPIQLISQKMPNSWPIPGFEANDPNAVVTLEFSGPVAKVSEVSIVNASVSEGSQTSGDEPPLSVDISQLYPERIQYDGNVVTIDLSGIKLEQTIDRYDESTGQTTTVTSPFAVKTSTFKIGWVEGANGLNAKFDGSNWFTYFFTPDTSTGIQNVVEAADGVYKVYNLQGVNILNTVNAADLNSLTPGLYIVNGKKVLIRK